MSCAGFTFYQAQGNFGFLIILFGVIIILYHIIWSVNNFISYYFDKHVDID